VNLSIARCLVDANRAPDSLDNPDGAVKTQTSYGEPIYRTPLSYSERIDLRERYWRPFHTELDTLMRQQAGKVRLLLDCHNMAQRGPDAYNDPGQARPFICIANMGDSRGESVPHRGPLTMPPALARKARDLAHDFFSDLTLLEPNPEATPVAMLNSPFAGGYILQQYRSDAYPHAFGLNAADLYFSLMIEINRGLFVGNQRPHTPIEPPRTLQIAAVRRRLYQWLTALLAVIEEAVESGPTWLEEQGW
jgi:N-formylglutamate amidohydrolase